MADNWASACKAAMKILGDKGKIPKFPGNITKALAAEDKAYGDFDKIRQELKAKLLLLQNAEAGVKDNTSQFQDEIEEDDLGLNGSDKDDAKKIKQARQILSDSLQGSLDTADRNFKRLKELDKHLMNMINYTPTP